jgi:hypothetical protein
MKRLHTGLSGLVLLLAVAAACSSSPKDDDNASERARPLTCDEKPDPHCDHPINRLVIPKLRTIGLEPRDAEPTEVCRRLAVDLIGRIPTIEELDRCTQEPLLDRRADQFMAMPEYVVTQRRSWAETFGFNTYLMWYGDAVDIDKIVQRLYAGEIDYPSFATTIVVHPGFYALHQGDDWAANVISVFLGRTARPDEIAGLRPLKFVFESRPFCDGAIWTTLYGDLIADGLTPENAKKEADLGCVGSEEFVYNFCGCYAGEASIGCKSTALGMPIDFGTNGCKNGEEPESAINFYRANESIIPGARTQCGKAGPCQDRAVSEEETVQGVLSPLQLVDQPSRDRLAGVGRALINREDFWEAGADREIARLIGWWKDGIRRPDFDFPEVRTLLANELKAKKDLRAIQKLIVTSLLYAAPSSPPPNFGMGAGKELPLWTMGGTKMLTAENWLDSAAIATRGKVVGSCDYRFVAIGEIGPTYVDTDLVQRLAAAPDFEAYEYDLSAQLLGGCSAEQPRPKTSSVGIAYAQHDLARRLCASSPDVLPGGFDKANASDEALRGAADHVMRRALSRSATEEERALLTTEMRECMAAGPTEGCESAEAAVRWMCTRVIDSATFALY